jgi:hypothetical protein
MEPQITAKELIDTSQVTSEASTTKIKPKKQFKFLHIFHRTSGVRDKETSSEARLGRGKLSF